MLRVRLGKGSVDEITRAINNYYRSNHTENMKECREKRKRVPIPRENSEQENVFAYPTARQPALEFAPHALPTSNYQIHTYVIEQYPPSANTNIATSGNALRLERAAAAALQKPSRTEESNNTVCRDSTQMQLLYRRSIKQNWLTESIEQKTPSRRNSARG